MRSRGRQIYRVLSNPRCNDWNIEPEYIVVPYTIIGESKNGKAFLVERNGWHGKKHQHTVLKSQFFFAKEEAEEERKKRTFLLLSTLRSDGGGE